MGVYSQIQVQQGYRIMVVSNGSRKVSKELESLSNCGYTVISMEATSEAIEEISNEKADLLLVDSSILGDTNTNIFEQVCSKNKSVYTLLLVEENGKVPSIKTMKKYNIQGYWEKSNNCSQLLLLVESGIQCVYQEREIQKINNELLDTKELLKKNYLESIETLRHTVEAKDPYTRGHSDRVAEYSVLIGKKLGLSDLDLKKLHTGGLFHDIGKIGIPDNILFKNTKLSNDEYLKIKDHASIGARILSEASIFNDIIPIVKHHHERFDGNGYPDNLRGEEIPLLARITSVADSFDAMFSKRAYRDKMDVVDVVAEIARNRGTQFDPVIADAFLDVIENEFESVQRIAVGNEFESMKK